MRKIIIAFTAVVMVLIFTIVGTFAYLTKTSGPVKNTFVAGKFTDNLVLTEHEAKQETDGTYTLSTETTAQANSYVVTPGNDLPKDPYITVDVDEDVKAFLFITVNDTLPTALTWSIDSAHWMELMDGEEQVKKNGLPVWVYTGGGTEAARFNGALTKEMTNIMTQTGGKSITVPNEFDTSTMTANATLEFNAYLCQADSFDSALASWNACFGDSATE